MAKTKTDTEQAVSPTSVCTLKGTKESKHMKTGQEYNAVPGNTANHLIKTGHAELVKEYTAIEWAAEVKKKQQEKNAIQKEAEEARKKAK